MRTTDLGRMGGGYEFRYTNGKGADEIQDISHTHKHTFEMPETAEITPFTRDIFLGTRGYCKCPAERRAAVCVI